MNTVLRDYNSIITDLSESINTAASIPTLLGDINSLQSNLEQLIDLKKWINEQAKPLSRLHMIHIQDDLLDQLYQLYSTSKSKSYPFSLEVWEYVLIKDEVIANGNKAINPMRELCLVISKNGIKRYKLQDVVVDQGLIYDAMAAEERKARYLSVGLIA